MVLWKRIDPVLSYQDGIEMMESRLNEVISGQSDETIFLLEHDHVYTAGTGFNSNELLKPHIIPVIYTGRGGKFTYHGPGQRVIYPILDLKRENRQRDVKMLIRNFENWIIDSLRDVGVESYIIPGLVGIWVGDVSNPKKIAAIGIRLRKWVSYHGIAVNISTDLSMYDGIIPCGITQFKITSLNKLGINLTILEFDELLKKNFKKYF